MSAKTKMAGKKKIIGREDHWQMVLVLKPVY